MKKTVEERKFGPAERTVSSGNTEYLSSSHCGAREWCHAYSPGEIPAIGRNYSFDITERICCLLAQKTDRWYSLGGSPVRLLSSHHGAAPEWLRSRSCGTPYPHRRTSVTIYWGGGRNPEADRTGRDHTGMIPSHSSPRGRTSERIGPSRCWAPRARA